MVRVDAHCHVWRLARGDYGWLSAGADDLAPLRRDFDVDDLSDAMPGMAASILVQAAPTAAETAFMLGRARAAGPRVAGVVGWVDLADPRCAADVERLAADPLFKGVRPMLQDLADPDWIAARPAPACMEALRRRGLRFDALVTPRELPGLRRFAERHPDLPVMVDHAAKPALGAAPDAEANAVWRREMTRLAAGPAVFCKLSGLLTLLPEGRRRSPEAAAEALRPVMDALLAWFGPRRIAWGSDWPVVTLAAPSPFWLAATDLLLSGLSAGDRAAVLGGTAARFYGLAAAAVA